MIAGTLSKGASGLTAEVNGTGRCGNGQFVSPDNGRSQSLKGSPWQQAPQQFGSPQVGQRMAVTSSAIPLVMIYAPELSRRLSACQLIHY